MTGAEPDPRARPEGPWNIDGVIPREPWEDRSRDGGLETRLDTLERRLHAAVDRVEDIPVALERRMSAMEAELRQRLEDFDLTVSGLERVADSELPGRLIEMAGGLATLETRVEQLGGLVSDLGAVVAQLRAEGSSSRQEIAAAARSVEARVVATVRAATDEFLADAQEAVSSAHVAGGRMARLADRVTELHDVLAAHRSSLAATLQHERAALVQEVVETAIDALSSRQRRALAEKLLERGRPRGAEEPANLEDVPALGPSEATEMAAAVPDVAGPGGGSTDGFEEDEDPVGVYPPPPPLVVPDPPADVSGRAADRSREELVTVVLEVKGIGPARAEALADAFGSLERLGVSDVEEVAALADLYPKQAARVLDHVRGGDA